MGAAALVQRQLDPDALRRAVIASVQRQSGRTVTLDRLDVRLLPTPRVSADGFTLGDRPGSERAGSGAVPMLRVGHLEAGIGIWPLLRHVVRLKGLALDHVTLHLRRDADGHGNWEMGPVPDAPGASRGGASRGGARWGAELGDVAVTSAVLSLHDRLLHRDADLVLGTLSLSGLQGGQPGFDLTGARAGAGYALHGTAGPVRRLFDGGDQRTPWPLSVRGSETVAGTVVAHGEVAGTFTDPVRGRGYDLTFTAAVTQLADLDRLFPHAGLPRMQGLDASGHLLDEGRPALAALRANAGATEIPRLHGVMLQSWSVAAPASDAPLDLAAAGAWQGRALVLKGTAASLRMVNTMLGRLGTAGPPLPVRLALGLGDSAWRIEGMAGAEAGDVRVQGLVPDLRTLLAGAPDLGRMTIGTRLQVDRASVRLSDLRLAGAAGDLGGALTFPRQGRHSVSGQLHSARLDLDRLMAERPAPPAAAGIVRPAPAATITPPPQAAMITPPPQGAMITRPPEAVMITQPPQGAKAILPQPVAAPGVAWNLALLRRWDADLSLRVDDLLIGGSHYRDFVTGARLLDGHLLAEPRASGPAGAIAARLQVDAAASPPTLRVWMHPVMLPASALASLPGAAGLFGTQGLLRGTVELVGDVRAGGDDWAALAGSAQGHLGLSMTDALVSNAGLLRLLGRSSAVAMAVPPAGETALSCLAVHAVLGQGQASMDTLSLRSGRLSVDGHGRIGLADGGLDLHLQPEAQVGAAWASLPVRLEGSLRDPHPALDPAASGGRYRLTIGSANDPAHPGGADCETPLRVAREGMTGPAAMVSRVTAEPRRKAPKPIDILRGLGILR